MDLLRAYAAKNTTGSDEDDSFTEDRYRQVARYIPYRARTVLDVGCNDGRGGAVLSALNERLSVSGLDAVQEKLDGLPACYAAGIHGLSTEIPAEDGAFDVVVAAEFLEHLYPRDVDPSICEMQRVLAIGGRLILTTPNPHYVRLKLTKGSVYCSYHLTQHPPHTLKRRLVMHGFSNVRLLGSGRVSSYLGSHVPLLGLYGSYLIVADKR